MIKKLFKTKRLTNREKAMAKVCCSQMVVVMQKKMDVGELSESDVVILCELKEIVEKLEPAQ